MNRVQRYRDRAAECRQLAEIAYSSEARRDYERLAESYMALADSEAAPRCRARCAGLHERANDRRTAPGPAGLCSLTKRSAHVRTRQRISARFGKGEIV